VVLPALSTMTLVPLLSVYATRGEAEMEQPHVV